MKIFQSPLLRFQLSHCFAVLLLALAAAAPGLCAPIHDAARTGDLAKVEALVNADPSLVSSLDEKFGQTPLHFAAFNNHQDVAEFLLAHQADVNAKSKNGSTPLHLAAGKGNKEMVELLLAHKAEIDAVDNEGWSPVHTAAVFNQKEVEDLLIAKGGTDLPAPRKPPTPPPAADTHAEKAPPKVTGKDDRFTSYDDGTVVDTKAKLMWMGRDGGTALSWPDAKNYAKENREAGYSDWRLPTLAEVSSLYDKDKTRKTFCPAAVDEMGAAANEIHLAEGIRLTCVREWTSQERSGKPGWATVFDFHTGKDAARPDGKDFVDTACRVLLVRDVK